MPVGKVTKTQARAVILKELAEHGRMTPTASKFKKEANLSTADVNQLRGMIKEGLYSTAKQAPKRTAKKRLPRKARKKNPVGLTESQKIKQAMKLYERFHVMEPQYIDELDVVVPDVCVAIGKCDGVLYTTIREGQKESYIHEFGERSKPVLASSYDGKQLFILQGNYKFTDRGIIDK